MQAAGRHASACFWIIGREYHVSPPPKAMLQRQASPPFSHVTCKAMAGIQVGIGVVVVMFYAAVLLSEGGMLAGERGSQAMSPPPAWRLFTYKMQCHTGMSACHA